MIGSIAGAQKRLAPLPAFPAPDAEQRVPLGVIKQAEKRVR